MQQRNGKPEVHDITIIICAVASSAFDWLFSKQMVLHPLTVCD